MEKKAELICSTAARTGDTVRRSTGGPLTERIDELTGHLRNTRRTTIPAAAC